MTNATKKELALRKHCTALEHALAGVSGALVDSGVVVPDDPARYGDTVRALTAERDEAQRLIRYDNTGANAEIAGYRASIEQHLVEINALYADLAAARADIETVSRERDAALRAYDTDHVVHGAEVKRLIAEINRLLVDLAAARADIETVSRERDLGASLLARQCDLARQAETERDAALHQVSRLTEAIEKHRDRYLAHLQASECNQADRDLWSVLAAAARQGEKEKA